ncbi:MAG: hypothetical protein WC227_01870 [Patescibacteria group bacterium]|jgi:hypothetical protein
MKISVKTEENTANPLLYRAIRMLESGEINVLSVVWEKEEGFDFRIEAEYFRPGNANFIVYDDDGEIIASGCNSQDQGEEELVPFTREGFREFAQMANEMGFVAQSGNWPK